MTATNHFRMQHKELLKLVSDVSRSLNETEISNDATKVRNTLSKLLGSLTIHLPWKINHCIHHY